MLYQPQLIRVCDHQSYPTYQDISRQGSSGRSKTLRLSRSQWTALSLCFSLHIQRMLQELQASRHQHYRRHCLRKSKEFISLSPQQTPRYVHWSDLCRVSMFQPVTDKGSRITAIGFDQSGVTSCSLSPCPCLRVERSRAPFQALGCWESK